jgi:hypothetical protein
MYEDLFKSASTSSSRSKNFELLDAEQKQDVTEFVAWLESNTSFSKNSINSYKSYITKAIVDPTNLTNDQKSAIRKFQEFMNS